MNFERLWHYERFTPHIGDNRDLPESEQLFFEVAVGLTYLELERAKEAASALFSAPPKTPALSDAPALSPAELAAAEYERLAGRLADILGPHIRLGATHHSLNGKPIATLRDYLRFAVEQPGVFNVLELTRTLARFNSVSGSQELFSAPPSGGSTSTTRPPGASAGSQKGGR